MLKFKGLKKACGIIRANCVQYGKGLLPSLYVQISYNRKTGEVLTNVHTDANSRTVYHDSNIMYVTITGYTLTRLEIKNAIKNKLDDLQHINFYNSKEA